MMSKIIKTTIGILLIWTTLLQPVFGILLFKAGYVMTGIFITTAGIVIWAITILAIIHEIILKK